MLKKRGKKALLDAFLEQNSIIHVDETAWRRIRGEFPQEAPGSLRRLLRQSRATVDPPYAGVDQSDLDALEHSLKAIGEAYAAHPERARLCRDAVIEAKDHARLASRNQRVAEEKRRVKAEMVEWMLVWLDDPAMFPAWVELRKGYAILRD